VNLEDTLFAGAVISKIKEHYDINCDSSHIAESLYAQAKKNLFSFLKKNDASHYHRLMGFGLEKDIRYCLAENTADVLPVYRDGILVI
jgi:2-phosphosulfolactate phosphatase